jgi:hypothetical protein
VDYQAADGMPVHLVVMYYIPGAQKNVYLKEVSTLVKAIRKSGGIEPIARASDLNAVRNQLLDWVGSVLGDAGPEAVARMIRLEVKTAQTAEPAAAAAPAALKQASQVALFSVLVTPSGALVLSQDASWNASLEKENNLSPRLSGGAPFAAAGRQVFVTGSTAYPGGRTLYQCVGVVPTG